MRSCLRKCRSGSTSDHLVELFHIAELLLYTGPEFEALQCPACYRVDAMVFLEEAFNVAETNIMIVFSELDKELIMVHRGFEVTSAVR